MLVNDYIQIHQSSRTRTDSLKMSSTEGKIQVQQPSVLQHSKERRNEAKLKNTAMDTQARSSQDPIKASIPLQSW